jgi:hypothetical protein
LLGIIVHNLTRGTFCIGGYASLLSLHAADLSSDAVILSLNAQCLVGFNLAEEGYLRSRDTFVNLGVNDLPIFANVSDRDEFNAPDINDALHLVNGFKELEDEESVGYLVFAKDGDGDIVAYDNIADGYGAMEDIGAGDGEVAPFKADCLAIGQHRPSEGDISAKCVFAY